MTLERLMEGLAAAKCLVGGDGDITVDVLDAKGNEIVIVNVLVSRNGVHV